MDQLSLPPTAVDRSIARAAARRTNPGIQKVARTATWAADEHILLGVAACIWLLSRRNTQRQKIIADHLLATVVASAALPHAIKKVVDQERPDRCMVGSDRRGVQESGNARDAFPSGHAMHIGAVASALSWMFPGKARLFWTVGAAISATRIAVLAHWASDVTVGLATGVALERALRTKAQARLATCGPTIRQ